MNWRNLWKITPVGEGAMIRFRGSERRHWLQNVLGDEFLEIQYSFEEVCAKTLYNLSHEPAPFDSDVPFRVVPSAFQLGRRLNIEDSAIVQILLA